MNLLPRSLFAFAIAGAVFGSLAHAADGNQVSSTHPRYFEDLRTTGVNRELSHAPIYGTFYDEASAEAYRNRSTRST